MAEKELMELGLTRNEAKTYLAALELGESTIVSLAKKSGVKRTTTYLAVESLKLKGFLSMTKKKKKVFFYAEDPRILQEKTEERKKAIDKLVPQLLSIANTIDNKPKIIFYEGMEGIKDVYRDTLKYPGQEMLAWVSEEAFRILDKEFIDYYIPKRIEKKIWVRAIGPDTAEIKDYKNREEKELRKMKLVDAQKYPIKVEIDLYGGKKIGIISFKEKIGLVIESPKIYETLKSAFEMYWDVLLK